MPDATAVQTYNITILSLYSQYFACTGYVFCGTCIHRYSFLLYRQHLSGTQWGCLWCNYLSSVRHTNTYHQQQTISPCSPCSSTEKNFTKFHSLIKVVLYWIIICFVNNSHFAHIIYTYLELNLNIACTAVWLYRGVLLSLVYGVYSVVHHKSASLLLSLAQIHWNTYCTTSFGGLEWFVCNKCTNLPHCCFQSHICTEMFTALQASVA